MHDKHGREIKEGDIVVVRSWSHGRLKPHKVVACNGDATSCNIMLDSLCGIPATSFNANECVLAVRENGEIVPEPKE